MLNISLRRKARQFSKLIRHSAMTRRTGKSSRPVLAKNNQMGVTFIGHSSFLIQIGGQSLVIDPNFAKWIFVLKRLRRPGVRIRELPPIDMVLVSHAHFDHLHRPSLRAIARYSRRKSGKAPIIIVPENVADLVSDLGFLDVIEMKTWEEMRHGTLNIAHVPANHWGARIIRDMHRGFGVCNRNWRSFQSEHTIRLRFAMCIPTPKTPFKRFSISARGGWYRCTMEPSVYLTNLLTNHSSSWNAKRNDTASLIVFWSFVKESREYFHNSGGLPTISYSQGIQPNPAATCSV
jgi:hypothetical protein